VNRMLRRMFVLKIEGFTGAQRKYVRRSFILCKL
jgi:hypothetical protein